MAISGEVGHTFKIKAVHPREFMDLVGHLLYRAPHKRATEAEATDTIIGNYFMGFYNAVVGLVDEEPMGFMIFQEKGHTITSKLLVSEGFLKEFYSALLKEMRRTGYTSFMFESSVGNKEVWERILGINHMHHLYSVYSIDISDRER